MKISVFSYVWFNALSTIIPNTHDSISNLTYNPNPVSCVIDKIICSHSIKSYMSLKTKKRYTGDYTDYYMDGFVYNVPIQEISTCSIKDFDHNHYKRGGLKNACGQ